VKFKRDNTEETYTLTPNVALQQRYAHSKDLAQNLPNLVQNLGIEVTSTHEVSLAGTSIQKASTDAFLALPVDVLSNEYIALSHDEGALGGPYVQLVAVEDNTQVTITPKTAFGVHPAGVPFNVTLNKCQSVMYMSNQNQDLAGTRLIANKLDSRGVHQAEHSAREEWCGTGNNSGC